MHSINKRKVDLWQDEWEKEANVTNISKRHPPNRMAVYTSILEQQHSQLSQTCTDLESTLAFLTTKLASLEASLAEKHAETNDKRQQHRQALAESIERSTIGFLKQQKGCLGTLHENQKDLDQVLDQDRALSATLDRLQLHYESSLVSSPLDDKATTIGDGSDHGLSSSSGNKITAHKYQNSKDTLQMNELMATHNELELRYMNAKSKAEGYRARAHVLDMELRKVNGLPQIIPILKTSTETHKRGIQQYQQYQMNLPLSDSIKALGQLRIKAPLQISHQIKENQQIRQAVLRLKKVYLGLIRQRALQQLLLYSYQVETKHLLSYKHALMAYHQDLQKEHDTVNITSSKQHTHHPETMTRIKHLLSTHHKKTGLLDSSTDYNQMTDDQVVKTVEKLVASEHAWNKKWSEDVNDSLDAIPLLDQSKHELADTLFGKSTSREKLDLKPKSYDDLQWTLESTLDNLQSEADSLEKEYQTNDALFKNRRSFVSLFFTDPFAFESKMEQHLDSLQEHGHYNA